MNESGGTASIEDVARLAGVSIATVSRSLRGLPEVAPGTRDRVLAAARTLDYVASPFAARLASGRTSTIGVVVPFVDRWFFGKVLGAIEGSLGNAGYDVLLYNLGDAEGRERFFTTLPVRKRVDALIMVSMPLADAEIDALRGLNMPVGLVGIDVAEFFSVRIDDVCGAESAVRHLIGGGHRRIGLIGGDTDDPMRFTPPLFRRNGYLAGLDAAGLPFDPALEVLGYFTVEGGEAAMRAMLDLPDPPTAVFAESDEMAYGAMRAIRRAGLRVAEDVAVIGFDDHDMAELMDLTTVRQPVVEQGRILADMLLAGIDSAVLAPTATVVPTELIVRGSTDPSRTTYALIPPAESS
jgi:LacI family transcriptional regulator, repressor for deo operon, udp, cdd, tsx, nupC, and nupG